MTSVNSRIQDALVRHSVELQRYGNGLARDIQAILDSADAAILEKLGGRLSLIEQRGYDLGPASTKRLQTLLRDLRTLNRDVYKRVWDELKASLGDFAIEEADFQSKVLKTTLPIEIATTLPTPAVLRTLVTTAPMEGQLLKHWVDGMESGRLDRLNRAIRNGIVNGETTDQIIRTIRGTRAGQYRDGVLQISRRSAQAIVRTATGHVATVAAQETWKGSNAVKGWSFLAVLDLRTSTTCAGLSGQVFPIGEGPLPPRHLNCRSAAIPITKSYRELGLDKDDLPAGDRASMDGQVPGDLTFSDWLKKKGPSAQDKILGPTRAQWFRDGKLSLSDLVKGDGSVLTLDQLRQRYGDILQ